MASSFLNKREIEKFRRELTKELNKDGGIRVDVNAEAGSNSGFSAELDPNGSLYLAVHRMLLFCDESSRRLTHVENPDQALGLEGLDQETAESLFERALDLLSDKGLVKLFPTMNSRYSMFDITDSGRVQATELRERRTKPSYRTRILRSSLLRWLHENERASTLQEVPLTYRHVEGSEASAEELGRVADDLRERGLITPANEEGTLELTEQGRRCVENFGGNVSKYEESKPQAGTTYNINFNGATSGVQVSQGNNNTLNQDNRSEMTDQVRGFLDSLKQVRDSIDLDQGSAAELDQAVVSLNEVLQAEEPEPTRIGVMLRWIGDVLNKAAAQTASGTAIPLVLAGLNALFTNFPQLGA